MEIKTRDVHADISADVHRWLDTCKFKEGHPSGIPTGVNKRVPLMFKDEMAGKPILECVGLRLKMYAFTHFGGEEKRQRVYQRGWWKRALTLTITKNI